jgi:hypothetical protein
MSLRRTGRLALGTIVTAVLGVFFVTLALAFWQFGADSMPPAAWVALGLTVLALSLAGCWYSAEAELEVERRITGLYGRTLLPTAADDLDDLPEYDNYR